MRVIMNVVTAVMLIVSCAFTGCAIRNMDRTIKLQKAAMPSLSNTYFFSPTPYDEPAIKLPAKSEVVPAITFASSSPYATYVSGDAVANQSNSVAVSGSGNVVNSTNQTNLTGDTQGWTWTWVNADPSKPPACSNNGIARKRKPVKGFITPEWECVDGFIWGCADQSRALETSIDGKVRWCQAARLSPNANASDEGRVK